jgi:hypothetical protein
VLVLRQRLSPAQELLRLGLIAGANAALVAGLATFAHAARRAGLTFPGTRAARAAIVGVAIAVALLLAGQAMVEDVSNAANRVRGLANLASDLGEAAALVLIAPLVMTVVLLRGGVLAWPFILMTLARLAWLGFDAMNFVAPQLPWDKLTVRAIDELLRTAGCLWVCASALAHRMAARQ